MTENISCEDALHEFSYDKWNENRTCKKCGLKQTKQWVDVEDV